MRLSLCMSNMEYAGDRGEKKELRREYPSGWLYLTQHDAIPILVEALLDLPPNREFNKTELAEHAGVTRQTVGNYTDLLLEVELVSASVPDRRQQRRPRTIRVERRAQQRL